MSRYFKNWLQAYVQHTRFSESPDSFHFWTGVATVAGALRRHVWIDQREFQWTPNFYVVLVGPPGIVAKSTSIRGGIKLLEAIDPPVHFGPQSSTWQALTDALEKAQEGVYVNAGDEEAEIMSCLTIGVSELGTFLRPDNNELVDFLTDMWDGQRMVWRRQTRNSGSTTIVNPWLNLIACTTPAWLRDNFPEALIGAGLTSRMVFVYAEKKRQLVPYPSQLITGAEYKEEERQLIKDLEEIGKIVGEYTLSEEALSFGADWYEKHWNNPRPTHISSDRYAGYIARKQTHIHKLAMVLAAAKRDDRIVTSEDLREALAHIEIIEHDMVRVFSSIGVAPQARTTHELLATIRNYKRISHQQLWKLSMSTLAPQAYLDGIKSLVDAGYIVVGPKPQQIITLIQRQAPVDQTASQDKDPEPA